MDKYTSYNPVNYRATCRTLSVTDVTSFNAPNNLQARSISAELAASRGWSLLTLPPGILCYLLLLDCRLSLASCF